MGTSVPGTLRLWRRLRLLPWGRRLFSFGVCRRAPYFRTIRPRVVRLDPELCRVHVRNRRAVHNHLGTIHAIALCNLAEIAAGLLMEAQTPPTHRWIPKGMKVEYLAKAATDVTGDATGAIVLDPAEGRETEIEVRITDAAGTVVCRAAIAMWVAPKPRRAAAV